MEKETANNMENVNEMGIESITKLIFKFSVPAIVGTLCSAAQNIINRIFVGQEVGTDAISGLTICFPIFIIFMAISMLIGVGGTTLAALRLGEKEYDEAQVLLGQAFILITGSLIVVAALMYMFIEPLLAFCGATDPIVYGYAKEYLQVTTIAMVISNIGLSLNNFIRVEGNPKVAMITQLISCAVVVVSNYIFVVIFQWGVSGAASGNIVGSAVSFVWVLSYFRPNGKAVLKLKVKNFKLQFNLIKNIMILGIPAFLMQISSSAQNLILNRVLEAHGGTMALAAVGIVMSLSTIIILPMIGINQGVQPIMGYNYGACNFKRVKKALGIATLMAVIYGSICFVIIQLFPDKIVSIFGSDKDIAILELAAHAFKIYFLVLPIVGASIVCSSYFQASGKPIQATVINLCRQVLVYIPILLVLPRFFDLDGAWYAQPVADVASFMICMTLTFFAMRELNKRIKFQELREDN